MVETGKLLKKAVDFLMQSAICFLFKNTILKDSDRCIFCKNESVKIFRKKLQGASALYL